MGRHKNDVRKVVRSLVGYIQAVFCFVHWFGKPWHQNQSYAGRSASPADGHGRKSSEAGEASLTERAYVIPSGLSTPRQLITLHIGHKLHTRGSPPDPRTVAREA
ncbi:unnamed protein product [Ectocarpus sp. 13 AM-2016]